MSGHRDAYRRVNGSRGTSVDLGRIPGRELMLLDQEDGVGLGSGQPCQQQHAKRSIGFFLQSLGDGGGSEGSLRAVPTLPLSLTVAAMARGTLGSAWQNSGKSSPNACSRVKVMAK